MSPTNTFLFPEMKFSLKGRRFESVQEIKKITKAAYSDFFRIYIEFWEKWNFVGILTFMLQGSISSRVTFATAQVPGMPY
jgi:hypothetical protein